MRPDTLKEEIAAIFQQAGRAHHLAYLAEDGHDPEWPRWYADYLLPHLGDHLKSGISSAQLSELLTEMDEEHRRRSPKEDWSSFYAERLLQSDLARQP